MSWFADTSVFVAYFAPRDRRYALARQFLLVETEPIVTTQWVIAELGNYLSERPGRTLFADFVNHLDQLERVTIIPADSQSFQAGMSLYARRPDKLWSLVDCISFETMTAHNIRAALTTDHHFEQAGFSVLLK
jgi:uncharacterized protein